MNFRDDTTGEIGPGHRIGIDADGCALFVWPEGWTPVVPCWANADGHAVEETPDGESA